MKIVSNCFNFVTTMLSYHIKQWRTQGGGGEASPPPRNPGKFAKDREQPRPQPAIRIDSSRKL